MDYFMEVVSFGQLSNDSNQDTNFFLKNLFSLFQNFQFHNILKKGFSLIFKMLSIYFFSKTFENLNP